MKMLFILLISSVVLCLEAFLIDTDPCMSVTTVSRKQWGAREPENTANLTGNPLDKVFIHHTDMSDCTTFQQCVQEVKTIQNIHMDERGWSDVGYSFLIGEDGRVYEGRGWYRVGAHTLSYNRVAYGVALLGNFMFRRPNTLAITALKTLLQCGVSKGFLEADYSLYGHRDTGQGTLCPGDMLYDMIHHWQHFDPSGPKH